MKHRGLYGAAEGNETRRSADSFADHLADNDIVEGHDVAVLRARFEEKDWKRFSAFVEDMRQRKYNQTRIDSVVARASSGVRL